VTSATGNRGFTLLELLVVLTILVLLAGAWSFAAPRLFPAQQLRNETQRLIVALRLARMSARIRGAPQKVTLSLSGISASRAIVSDEIPRGVNALTPEGETSAGEKTLTLYPDGASTGAVITIGVGGKTATVRVGPVTGRAEVDP
jgi:prepilin-type N-terminal cleavage/methylation domain-containing protein